MKKLFVLLAIILVGSFSFAQEEELSDYEKYRMEQEEERFNPTTAVIPAPDTIYDTVYVEIDSEEPVVVNNNYYSNEYPDY
jgi:hypothetical protein